MCTMMICGGIRGGLLPGVLDLANGHVLCGIGKMCGIVKANFSETKEAEKTQIEELLCSGTLSVDELTEKSKRLPEVNDMIDEKTMRWLELSEIEG